MRGRKKKPVELQIAEGDPAKRGVHKLDELKANRPIAQRGMRPCPKHLTGEARAAWNDWKEQLELSGIDYKSSERTLEVLCIVYQALRKAQKNNDPVSINKFALAYRSLMSEFGFSPASMEGLTIEKRDEGGDLMAALTQPRERKGAAAVQ